MYDNLYVIRDCILYCAIYREVVLEPLGVATLATSAAGRVTAQSHANFRSTDRWE